MSTCVSAIDGWVLTRRRLAARNSPSAFGEFVQALKPWSIIGLLATVVLPFGLNSGAALATVVGELVEVPVMLSLSLSLSLSLWWR